MKKPRANKIQAQTSFLDQTSMLAVGTSTELTSKKLSDYFVANLDNPYLRDLPDLMEFPFFSLEKKKRLKPIIYERKNIKISIHGLHDYGIATIWDADFLIWVASQINMAREKGKTPTREILINPYTYLMQTGKISSTYCSGKLYGDLKMALTRLKGTLILTNLVSGGSKKTETWSWIQDWKVIEDETTGKMKGILIILAEWIFDRVIKDLSLLSICPEYFKLTSGIDRWLYKIARKHCGNQDVFTIGVDTLYEKYPPGREFRKYKFELKATVKANRIPEYDLSWSEEGPKVIITPKEGARERRKLSRALREIA